LFGSLEQWFLSQLLYSNKFSRRVTSDTLKLLGQDDVFDVEVTVIFLYSCVCLLFLAMSGHKNDVIKHASSMVEQALASHSDMQSLRPGFESTCVFCVFYFAGIIQTKANQ